MSDQRTVRFGFVATGVDSDGTMRSTQLQMDEVDSHCEKWPRDVLAISYSNEDLMATAEDELSKLLIAVSPDGIIAFSLVTADGESRELLKLWLRHTPPRHPFGVDNEVNSVIAYVQMDDSGLEATP